MFSSVICLCFSQKIIWRKDLDLCFIELLLVQCNLVACRTLPCSPYKVWAYVRLFYRRPNLWVLLGFLWNMNILELLFGKSTSLPLQDRVPQQWIFSHRLVCLRGGKILKLPRQSVMDTLQVACCSWWQEAVDFSGFGFFFLLWTFDLFPLGNIIAVNWSNLFYEYNLKPKHIFR